MHYDSNMILKHKPSASQASVTLAEDEILASFQYDGHAKQANTKTKPGDHRTSVGAQQRRVTPLIVIPEEALHC
jgi:hypothetical protein